MSIEYYDNNALTYAQQSNTADLTALYRPFVELIDGTKKLLDAGCGSGRDLKAFADMGLSVTGFDASPAMVQIAKEYSGQTVHCLQFSEITWDSEFDGIWACASLLHVPRTDLVKDTVRLVRALKPSGIIYMSFKYGTTERQQDGRHFTDMDESGMRNLVVAIPGLTIKQLWRTQDLLSSDRPDWMNCLSVKKSQE
jgi:2-polyprenyl-3-methyl-5-hydroxy-6-metoxy-1,4-benzoquinol methylase